MAKNTSCSFCWRKVFVSVSEPNVNYCEVHYNAFIKKVKFNEMFNKMTGSAYTFLLGVLVGVLISVLARVG